MNGSEAENEIIHGIYKATTMFAYGDETLEHFEACGIENMAWETYEKGVS
ncbi:MAG: hypothetical protein ACTSSE_08650 [Candidatus Thorarchaeota archaeon]